jgi:hypothetical protein
VIAVAGVLVAMSCLALGGYLPVTRLKPTRLLLPVADAT